jgi:hypothetical protein
MVLRWPWVPEPDVVAIAPHDLVAEALQPCGESFP